MSGRLAQIGYFLRLVRIMNLLIIAATMFIIRYVVFDVWIIHDFTKANPGDHIEVLKHLNLLHVEAHFILLVICICFIAGAGNIINDYFDIKADRVNRPETIVIGKHIKRRWAIVINWALNSVAFMIALYLGWFYQSLSFVIIPFLSITFLWLYSMYFKRQLLVGNVSIALLTSAVIILTAHQALCELPLIVSLKSKVILMDYSPAIFLTTILASFAFITNFTREIVKDINDIEGDKKIACRTIPIVHGAKTAKLFVGVLLFIQLFFFIMLIAMAPSKMDGSGSTLFPMAIGIGLIVLYLTAFIINIVAKTRSQHYRISMLLKMIMLLGLMFPLNLLL